jgi:hypothetical protein
MVRVLEGDVAQQSLRPQSQPIPGVDRRVPDPVARQETAPGQTPRILSFKMLWKKKSHCQSAKTADAEKSTIVNVIS